MSYENYEKMNKDKIKKIQIKMNKNKSLEGNKTQSLSNKLYYDNKKKITLNNLHFLNNNYNYNNSISCKSKPFSRNNTNILFCQKSEQNNKNKKVLSMK